MVFEEVNDGRERNDAKWWSDKGTLENPNVMAGLVKLKNGLYDTEPNEVDCGILRVSTENYKRWTEEENEKKIKESNVKKEVKLPQAGKLISEFILENSNILKDKNIIFYRPDSKDVVEIGKIKIHKTGEEKYMGFVTMSPNRYITLIEDYIEPGIEKYNEYFNRLEFKKKSISTNLSMIILESQKFQQSLPQIERIFTIPIPIIHDGKLTFPKKGYDKRFSSWLPHDTPEISHPEMALDEAKGIIYNILSDFCFKSNQDYVNAISGLLTPFLRGIFPNFNTRTPLFFYIANRERAGKDYLAGITGILYEGYALEEPALCNDEKFGGGNSEELRKKITGAMIKGRKRLHFSNNKGYINNTILEGLLTAKRYSDRPLGRSDILEFDNEMDYSLSGNIGIRWTPDLGNRSRFIKLFLALEDANKRIFKNPNLHEWILKNRNLILSAMYCLVKNWIDKGMPSSKVSFSSFPEWAETCGGIMESAGYNSPCEADKENLMLSGDVETNDMKKLFELGYEIYGDKCFSKKDMKELISKSEEELFNWLDFYNKADQTKFGILINKFVGRELGEVTLKCINPDVRGQRQHLKFTKKKTIIDQKEIFLNECDGNLQKLFCEK